MYNDMLKKSGILMIFILSVAIAAHAEFTYEGTLSEDGNDVWNKNEVEIYSIKLGAGETLEASLTGDGDLDLRLYYGLATFDSFTTSMEHDSYVAISQGLDSEESLNYTAGDDEQLALAVYSTSQNSEGDYHFKLTTNLEMTQGMSLTTILIIAGGVIVFVAIFLFILKKQGRI